MPKTTTQYARLKAASMYDIVKLVDRESETNERLFEVLTDDFYLKKLTSALEEMYPSELAPWINYRKTLSIKDRPEEIGIVAKFNVTDKKVDLVDAVIY